jgi:hypothetical protein
MSNSFYLKLMLFALFAIKLTHGQDASFVTYKTYVNKGQQYEILYPEKWYIKSERIKDSHSGREVRCTFIENVKAKVVPLYFSTGKQPTKNGTSFQLYVIEIDTTKDIEEQITAFDLPCVDKNKRLEAKREISMDGHNLLVHSKKGETGCSADFVYRGRYYSLQLYSGSEDRFINDYPIFKNILKTFQFR